MENYPKNKLIENSKIVNWRKVSFLIGLYSIIIGISTTLFVSLFFLYRHLSIRLSQLSRLPDSTKLSVFLFIFVLFIAFTLISGLIEYRRHKQLLSAIITVATTFCLSGGIIFMGLFVTLGFMDYFFNQNYPMKTD